MTPDTFIDGILTTVIDKGVASYKEMFADPGEVTDKYWLHVLELYQSLSPARRKVLLAIMRQVQVDTVSEVFGILDGTSHINGKFEEFDVIHKTRKSRVRLNGDLQDLFLEKTETE